MNETVTINRNSIYTPEQRREVYLRAAAIALEESKIPGESVFMCCCVSQAMHDVSAFDKRLLYNLPELFLFCTGISNDGTAWMSEQLMADGIKDLDEINKIKHVTLLLCAEMCG